MMFVSINVVLGRRLSARPLSRLRCPRILHRQGASVVQGRTVVHRPLALARPCARFVVREGSPSALLSAENPAQSSFVGAL